MTFTLKLFIVSAIFWIIFPTIYVSLICAIRTRNDPMYKKLKTKGKIKYFISQLLEVEF